MTNNPEPASDSQANDGVWFDNLFREHSGSVFRYLLRRGAASESEDLSAEAFAIAWRRRTDVPVGAELAWLYRTAGFVLANHRRKKRPVLVDELPDEVDHDDPAIRVVQDAQMRAALRALRPRDREVLLLAAWEGLTGEGLAAVLGTGRGGADAALSRARSRLREVWQHQEG